MGFYRTQIIKDESEVPPGYVPLANYGKKTATHRRLCAAHAEGAIRAVKQARYVGEMRTGRVWVHEQDAAAFLAAGSVAEKTQSRDCRQDALGNVGLDARQIEGAVIALCEINNGITLMHETIERLVDAVESIAPPKTAHRAMPDSAVETNGLFTANSTTKGHE